MTSLRRQIQLKPACRKSLPAEAARTVVTALALVGLRLHAPATARTVNTVLAASAGNDCLHAGFSWICGRASAQEREAERMPPPAARAPAGPRAA